MRNCIDGGTLQAWFDGELAADEASNVTAHLGRCVQCAEAARTRKDCPLSLRLQFPPSDCVNASMLPSMDFTFRECQPSVNHVGMRSPSRLIHFGLLPTHQLQQLWCWRDSSLSSI